MNKQQFIRRRRPVWRAFEKRVERLRGISLKRMTAKEISEFSRLMRELANDLATIRSRDWGQSLVDYLNGLLARGHNAFYSAPPGRLNQVTQFLAVGFPRLLRANIGYFLVAAALFFLPGAIAWTVIQNDPSLATRILPPQAMEQFDQMYGPTDKADPDSDGDDTEETSTSEWSDDEDDDSNQFGEERAAMAGFYVQHNVGIALQCFARGVLLGIGTIYTLLYNGIVIGAVGGYVLSLGHTEKFVSFIISHGSFELTAIAIAGGAGLMLGDALLHPGNRTRGEALLERSTQAVQIAAGAAVMLMIAALIEAFWSPAPIPAIYKYIVGTLLWLVVYAYLFLAGRNHAA